VIEADTSAETDTVFELEWRRLDFELDAPVSIAEGAAIEIDLCGAVIDHLDDRCGVLASVTLDSSVSRLASEDDRAANGIGGDTAPQSSRLTAVIRRGLLAPYRCYGRLGQLNFSRRSLFLFCRPDEGTPFWLPVDLTILPPFEATAELVGPQSAPRDHDAGSWRIRLLVRNNTATAAEGLATLSVFKTRLPVEVAVAARSEAAFSVVLPLECTTRGSPGDNEASLILPSGVVQELKIDCSQFVASDAERLKAARKRTVVIPLPEDALTAWNKRDDLRLFYSHLTADLADPLAGFAENLHNLTLPELPGVTFAIDKRRFVPVSSKSGRPSFTLPMDSRRCKKVYALLLAFIENHDMFCEVGRIELETDEPARHPQVGDGVVVRTLHSPGDLHWWLPRRTQVRTCTVPGSQTQRHGLLPLLPAGASDRSLGRPPSFPQREFWTDSLAVSMPQGILNVVEIDLERGMPIKSLTLSTSGPGPALGLVAVTVETASEAVSSDRVGTPAKGPQE